MRNNKIFWNYFCFNIWNVNWLCVALVAWNFSKFLLSTMIYRFVCNFFNIQTLLLQNKYVKKIFFTLECFQKWKQIEQIWIKITLRLLDALCISDRKPIQILISSIQWNFLKLFFLSFFLPPSNHGFVEKFIDFRINWTCNLTFFVPKKSLKLDKL